jgi:hypothetical protein
MLLGSLPKPGLGENWLWGRLFGKRPKEPVDVGIQDGYENAELMDYFGTPPVISNRMHDVLLSAGVDNLEVFDAVLSNEDDSVRYEGFKAINIIGLISAAGDQTEYDDDNESRLLDASIKTLSIDPKKAGGSLMFRLAEYVGAVIVHERVKAAVEAASIPNMVFEDPKDFIS